MLQDPTKMNYLRYKTEILKALLFIKYLDTDSPYFMDYEPDDDLIEEIIKGLKDGEETSK